MVPINYGAYNFVVPAPIKGKLVGDAYVQARLIRKQIMRYIGRSLLIRTAIIMKIQVQRLYNDSLDFIDNKYHKGKALYGQRFNNKDKQGKNIHDLIWPEERIINGQKVIVPIVHLSDTTLIQSQPKGHKNEFNGETTIIGSLKTNGSNILKIRSKYLTVMNNIHNNGTIIADNDLKAKLHGSLENHGTITAKQSLDILAKNINHKTQVLYVANNTQGHFAQFATIEAENGNLRLAAEEDIHLAGARLKAGEHVTLEGRNIFIGTSSTKTQLSGEDGLSGDVSYIKHIGSTIDAEEGIKLLAGGTLEITASKLQTKGFIELLAHQGVYLESEYDQTYKNIKGRRGRSETTLNQFTQTAIRTLLDAGKGVIIRTELGNVVLRGTQIESGEDVHIQAKSGKVQMLMAKEYDKLDRVDTTSNKFTQTTISQGYEKQDMLYPTIVGGQKIEALYGVEVEYIGSDDEDKSLDEHVDTLSQMEGLAWMADVRRDYPYEFKQVETYFNEYYDKTTALTPEFTAVVSIALAIVAGPGIGDFMVAAVGKGATAAALTAGATNAATMQSLNVVNAMLNGDDIFDATVEGYQKMLKTESIKQIATAALTAGALDKISSIQQAKQLKEAKALADAGQKVQEASSLVQFGHQAQQALTQAVASSTIHWAINGGDFESFRDGLSRSLATQAVNAIGAKVAQEIKHKTNSMLPNNKSLGNVIRYMGHALSGCVSGSLLAEVDQQISK